MMRPSEAFAKVGLAPAWVGAMRAHPAELRDFLKRYHRASVRAFHSDVAKNPLTEQAGQINQAWEALDGLTLEELAQSAGVYADSTSMSADELIGLMADTVLTIQVKNQSEATRADELEIALAIANRRAQESEHEWFKFLNVLFSNDLRGYSVPEEFGLYGHWLNLGQMRGRYLLTPFQIEREYVEVSRKESHRVRKPSEPEKPRLIEHVLVNVGYVTDEYELMTKKWNVKPLRKGMPDDEMLHYTRREVATRLEKLMANPVFTQSKNVGRIIGFTNSRVSDKMRYKIDGVSSWLSAGEEPMSPSKFVLSVNGTVSRQDVYFTPEQRADPGLRSYFLGLVMAKPYADSREESFHCNIFGIDEIIGFPEP